MKLSAFALVSATAAVVLLAACSGSPPNRMSFPQKADVGTRAYCQTLSEAQSIIYPGESSFLAMERYIVTRVSGYDGMGLPIQGTRLDADVEDARAYAASDAAFPFVKAVRNILGDCSYILSRSHRA